MTLREQLVADLDARVQERAAEYYGETGLYSPTGGIRIVLCPSCGRRSGVVLGRWATCSCGTQHLVVG